MEKQTIVKKSAAPFYLAAAAFALCSLLLPIYRWGGLLIVTVITAAVFVIAERVCPKKTVEVEVPAAQFTGDARVDSILRQGRAELVRIRAANQAIADPALSQKIDRMEALAERIFAQVAENPGQADRLRRFMSYYLPTTVKLLENIVSLEKNRDVQGENIQKSIASAERAADLIIAAFEKQLDNLYETKELDISTDVTVLEGMLKKEGLLSETDEKN